ncbi:LOW QUALITY PROTEIN: divergent paired-related homeobox-like [Dasypus novemcinctus]|uniref:LOW QUALITY PROTEIN: divergent paired-related homeobox-like n=1 Tax=Dasypus novemcinctus TaxID=9361 RepID=UPI0039C8E3E4
MTDSEDLRKGKHQRQPHRKRTTFTEKQLEDLKSWFNKNLCPDPGFQKEMAFKMGIHPTVLQVWFKNHRAKLKKAKYKCIQQKPQEAQQPQLPDKGVQSSPSMRGMDTPHGAPKVACPVSLVYINNSAPSFQLSVCPDFRVPTDHSVGHKIVHFGCCQDLTIYCFYPIWNPKFFPQAQLLILLFLYLYKELKKKKRISRQDSALSQKQRRKPKSCPRDLQTRTVLHNPRRARDREMKNPKREPHQLGRAPIPHFKERSLDKPVAHCS